MSDSPLLMFLSPQALFGMAVVAVIAAYIYIVWYLNIKNMRDPNGKNKGFSVFLFILFGVVLPGYLIWLNVVEGRNAPALNKPAQFNISTLHPSEVAPPPPSWKYSQPAPATTPPTAVVGSQTNIKQN